MRKTVTIAAAAAVLGMSPMGQAAETPDTAELARQVEALAAQVQALQQQLDAARAAIATVQSPQMTTPSAAAPVPAAAPAAPAPAAAAPPPTGWWNDTVISGRMYYDVTTIDHKSNGVDQSDKGTGFDIKRFYIGIDHTFDSVFSGNITTDFTYDSGPASATQLYIKKAYLQAKLSDAFVLRLGSTDLPWVPFMEDAYGYRYLENVLVDRTKFGTSADWGVHASGKLADGFISYAVAAVDGAGYKHPFRSKGVDLEGRVSANYNGFIAGVGGYAGKLGKDFEGATTYHTAKRFDVMAGYNAGGLRAGVEYFTASNWAEVNSPVGNKSEGWSGYASYAFAPQWAVFGRYDWVKPKKATFPGLTEDYFNVGVSYSPVKIVDFALAYKRDKAENGIISTSNGVIGGSVDGTYDEVGVWGQFRW